jgi:hypothetical protein
MTQILIFLGIVVFVTFCALVCASFHDTLDGGGPMRRGWNFLRKTFVPTTKFDFWFPPCPLCWVARAAAMGLCVMVFQSI